jgi:transcriptional regulator with XRE-family HTH domain
MTKDKADEEFRIALQILRIVRGWTQEDLAKACGLRRGTISDYERGKMSPGQRTMQRFLAAEGFSLTALEDAQTFVRRLRGESLGGIEDLGAEVWQALGDPALRREIEEVSLEAGRVVCRIVRLLMIVLQRETAARPERDSTAKSERAEQEEKAA